jgi:hypothetical protein
MDAGSLRDSIIRRLAERPGAKPIAYWQRVVGDIRVAPVGNWSISLYGTLAERLATAEAAWAVEKEWPLIEP